MKLQQGFAELLDNQKRIGAGQAIVLGGIADFWEAP